MKLKFPIVDSLLEAGRAVADYLTARLKSKGQRAGEDFAEDAERTRVASAARRRRADKRRSRMRKAGQSKPSGKSGGKRKPG